MSMEQRGQYITLLCEQHQNGHIPNNHMISVCESNDSPVMQKFVQDEKGFFYNKRMEEEKEKRLTYCASRSNNKSGRKPNKSYDSTYDKSYGNHMSLHMDNGNEDDNINTNANDNFNQFWLAYPRKEGKGKVQQIWKKIKEPSETIKKILTALAWQKNTEQWQKDSGQFIPMPATYLNQQRWLDEYRPPDDDEAVVKERIRLKKERGEL